MPQGTDELEAAVRTAVQPDLSELIRAKKSIKGMLSDGEPHGIRSIQGCLLAEEGISFTPAHGEKLLLGSADDIPTVVNASNPLLARQRLAMAASEALVDLTSQGIVVEVTDAPVAGDGNAIVGNTINVGYQLGNFGSAVRVATHQPSFSSAYRLAPRFAREVGMWFVDPDIFTSDLDDLDLDPRTTRNVSEALDAFRNGLFLACANLLGAASEGAWYAAGERLRDLDDQLSRALDEDNTKKVIARVGDVLRQSAASRSFVDELTAQAGLFRQLRNYGVHPRSSETDPLERFFSDSGAGLLVLETYTYFQRLSAAVKSRLADQ